MEMADEPDEEAAGTATISEDDVELLLDNLEFEANTTFLTRRQAAVLVMRERGHDQGAIADFLDCSRANVSNIERSARENIDKARETVSFEKLLSAPVSIELPAGLPLHEVPERIYDACDETEVKVKYGAPELSRKISAPFDVTNNEGTLPGDVIVTVTNDGEIHVIPASTSS